MWRRKKKKKKGDPATYIAIRLIAAKDIKKEFLDAADWLVDQGEITRDEIPEMLDQICKMEGNAGELGRKIREALRRDGWSP